jgi:protein-tyrosine phosphatase
MKVLMVCLGNICRSPIAEELFRDACQKIGLQVQVDSAGTANYHTGKAPDSRMIRTASNFGHDISTLRARQFRASDFEDFDFIFAMDDENFSDLRKLAKNELLATKGQFIWDGISDDQSKANIGTYIAVFEVFNLNGSSIFVKKKAFVVAGKI